MSSSRVFRASRGRGLGRAPRSLPILLLLIAGSRGVGQSSRTPEAAQAPLNRPQAVEARWYDRFQIRGYGQFRYNQIAASNPEYLCEQCDRSWGANGGLAIRRARLIVQGQIHPHLFIYLQPELATSLAGTNNVATLRDWYADVGLDERNTFRVRFGQSKVPFSYEALQSSQNRVPLDRADATNSSVTNERDLGVFLYWAPAGIRERFRRLVADNLKGSGDYGVLALGAFNGQPLNRPEANDELHVVARASYPFAIGSQILEPGLAAYRGTYVVTADQRSTGVRGTPDWSYRDERVLASVALAPKPVGLLAEWNAGRGPEFNPVTDSIETRPLRGGFATLFYAWRVGSHVLFPFVRWQAYDGAKKYERDARRYRVRDTEVGVEWQPNPSFELVAEWYWGVRRFEDFQRQSWQQRGRLLRLHAQFNY